MSGVKPRRARLGRGLASLLGEADLVLDQAESGRMLPIGQLVPSPLQPRRDMAEDALADLTASIVAHGVLQPLLVRPMPAESNFQIIAGERRWRAAQRAGLHEIPVHIRELDDAAALAATLIENLQREDLNAIEEAEGLRRLVDDFGLTQEMLAISVGKSRSHIANTMRLLGLPSTVQHDVRRGALSAGHARALLAHPNPAKAANIVLSRGLNVRQTEALARPPDGQPATSAGSQPLVDVTDLERDLTALLGLRVRITSNGRSGLVSLAYSSFDQLDGIVGLLKADKARESKQTCTDE